MLVSISKLPWQATHLSPGKIIRSALDIRHSTFAHYDPIILDLWDVLQAVIVGVQIAKIIGSASMHQHLLKHEVEILQVLLFDRRNCALPGTIATVSVLDEKDVCDMLLPLERPLHLALVAYIADNTTTAIATLQRESIVDLLQYILDNMGKLSFYGSNSQNASSLLRGLMSCSYPTLNHDLRHVQKLDLHQVMQITGLATNLVIGLGNQKAFDTMREQQHILAKQLLKTLSGNDIPPKTTASVVVNTAVQRCIMFENLAKSDIRFYPLRAAVRMACLKKDPLISSFLELYELDPDVERLYTDLMAWHSDK